MVKIERKMHNQLKIASLSLLLLSSSSCRSNDEADAEYKLVNRQQIAKDRYLTQYTIDTSVMATGSVGLVVSIETDPVHIGDKKNRILELRHAYTIDANAKDKMVTITYPMTADIKVLSTNVNGYKVQIKAGADTGSGYLKYGR